MREAALELRAHGYSNKAIAIELDTTESYLSQLIGRRHVTRVIDGCTVKEWARQTGITPDGIYKRLRAGWSPMRAVTREPRRAEMIEERSP